MKKNEVIFDESLIKVQEGMEIVHKAVTGTQGAAGKNIIFRDWSREPVATNDGYTIAESICLDDEAQSMGADLMKQAARRQNFEAGDGTTTVVAIAYSMIIEGLKKIKKGVNAMKLSRQMEEAVDAIVVKLKKSSHKVTTDKELFDVANLSMENSTLARVVVDAVKNAGENGRVVVQETNSVDTTVEEVKGIDFPRGYISPYMITNPVKLTADLEDVYVMVADKEFNLMKQIFPLMEGLKAKGVDRLLIICKNVIGEALGNVLANIKSGAFLCVVVQAPEDEDLLDDIAILTGAQKINEVNTPDCLTPMHIDYLGKAKGVSVSREKTIIDSGAGNQKKIDERIKAIKNEIADKEKKDIHTGHLRERLAKLDGKSVYIKVGAPTQQKMKYLKLKVDDAVASTSLAKKGGVVVGGGRALYDFSTVKPKNDGEEVVNASCAAPITKILENANYSPEDVLASLEPGQAFNVMTEKPVKDFLKEGIMDPVDIEMWALKNAVSVATGFITTFGAIVDVKPKNTDDK